VTSGVGGGGRLRRGDRDGRRQIQGPGLATATEQSNHTHCGNQARGDTRKTGSIKLYVH
jgi:hypothetical protein